MVADMLRFLKTYYVFNLKSAMEYRVNFFIQVIFMILNDVIWIIFWFVLLRSFGTINGWDLFDVLFLLGFVTLCFGLMATVFGNSRRIGELVAGGGLDFFMALPKPVLFHVLISRMSVPAIGDVIFGLLLIAVVIPKTLASVILLIPLVIMATVLMTAFTVLVQCVVFWFGNAERSARAGRDFVLTFSFYPLHIIDGVMRLFLFFVFPLAFMATVPSMLIQSFSWTTFGSMFLVTAVVTMITVLVFYKGVKRYESGNLVVVRT